MRRFKKIIKDNWLILLIVAVGVFLRVYQLPERFLYGHDQDLAGWFVRDVLVNHHLRLIGQETSTAGIFIGPVFYYLMTLFYKISGMDPIGGAYLVTVLAVFGMVSLYFVVNKIFGVRVATIALIIYSISNYMVFNDREVVPTMPVIIWTVWFVYCLHLIFQKKWTGGLCLFSVLAALIWHLNFALILTAPLIPIAMYLSKRKFEIKPIIASFEAFVALCLPLVLFELRHGFSQTKSLFFSLTTSQNDVISGVDKFVRVFALMSKNLHSLVIGDFPKIKYEHVMYVFLITFAILIYKKYLSRPWAIIFSIWIGTYYLFFSTYSKIVSEYYVNGTIIVFIIVSSLAISKVYESVKFRHIGVILVALFCVFSARKFALTSINKSGYVERREIIKEIKKDSLAHGFPCVSISYITDPGYNLGYRYFIYLEGLKTKPISEFVPVYTIVFPLKPIFPTSTTRGAIGLIYPDYDVYDGQIVSEKCAGDDYNLSEPMWGFPR